MVSTLGSTVGLQTISSPRGHAHLKKHATCADENINNSEASDRCVDGALLHVLGIDRRQFLTPHNPMPEHP